MSNKLLAVIIGVVVLVGVGGYFYSQQSEMDDSYVSETTETTTENQSETAVETPKETATETTTPAPSSVKSYSMTDVAMHKDASSCWSVINGNVYDLTAWVPKHPGGDSAILGLCGINGSEKFNKKHGGNSLQEGILAGYKIGVLK